ncbi:MAG: hypothetical protein K0U98_10480 [Deltaproteobacteria bacterium]|nr:hypothetical protein [Deltaproteobacteria bacterium]
MVFKIHRKPRHAPTTERHRPSDYHLVLIDFVKMESIVNDSGAGVIFEGV